MNTTRSLAAVLAMTLLAGAGIASAQQFYGPERTWEAPPAEFVAAQQRGYHDGVEGARKDFDNHRNPNVMNRDEYRNPHFIAPPDRADYQRGFREGYRVAVSHIYGYR